VDSENVSSSDLRYRRLFEAARDGILVVDPETCRIVDVNPYLVEFLGYSHREFLDKELYQIGLFEDETRSKAAFRDLLSRGYIRYEDLPLQTKDGRTVAVEFVSNIYMEGERRIIQCNVRDIAARKLADASLRQSEKRFKLVASAVSDLIWDWNLLTDNLWWSDGLKKAFGDASDEGELCRASWESRVHPGDLTQVTRGIRDAVDSGGDFWSAEYRFRRNDGRYAYVQDRGYILREADARAVRMLGGISDLTEQKKAEIQTAQARRMESVATLAGGIAHDLNNVLTPVLMSIDLLKSASGGEGERSMILETIQASCRRGADLVRQMLTFARGLDGRRTVVKMGKQIAELETMVSETFPRRIRMVTRVPGDLWPFTGDAAQLQQVLLNLAASARDSMPDGGTLSVTAENITLTAKDVAASGDGAPGRHVLLQVSDTGEGLGPAHQDRVFEPYFTTRQGGENSGFGLAIAHSFVKGHGGFLVVDSESGRGTNLKIYLPADPPPLSDFHPSGSLGKGRGEGSTVLVVDDELAIREMTRLNLETFGFRVITANNGAEAVALYAKRSDEISLVLTDIMMPVMDGAAAAQELRRINPDVRIVAVSGIEINEDTRANVNDFLAKPYTAVDLVKMVLSVLGLPIASPS
jgi:PAS domain S-box-containing protein